MARKSQGKPLDKSPSIPGLGRERCASGIFRKENVLTMGSISLCQSADDGRDEFEQALPEVMRPGGLLRIRARAKD